MKEKDKKLSVHLINYEMAFNDGILSKFARKTYDELEKLKDITVTIGNVPNPEANVNHSINYLPYKHSGKINTLMVTHIWEGYKLNALKEHLKTADMGICMSNNTKDMLIEEGLDKNKLCVILPAHDGLTPRHKVVSILTNVYPDGCKREEMFIKLIETLDHTKWAFRIMGSGWHDILVPLVAKGLQVDYFAEFEYDTHKKILDTSDYSLYFGVDEGSMGLLDAKNAGLKLIAPNIGFNIDMGIDYPFETQEELNKIFKDLSINPVEDWNWKKHAKEHVKLWKKLYENKNA